MQHVNALAKAVALLISFKTLMQTLCVFCLVQSGPKASLYLTVVGILAGFLSTFWNYGYQRTATRMQEYLDGANVAKIKKQQVSSRTCMHAQVRNMAHGVIMLTVQHGLCDPGTHYRCRTASHSQRC